MGYDTADTNGGEQGDRNGGGASSGDGGSSGDGSSNDGGARTGIGRRSLLRGIGVGALGTVGLSGAGLAGTAGAQSAGPSVDLADDVHPVGHEASGLLYGLSEDGSAPSNVWLDPIDHGLQVGGGARLGGGGWGTAGEAGYATRWNSVAQQYERVTSGSRDAEYCIRMSDLWGSDATQADSDPHPGDDGDWTRYYDFLDRIVSDVEAAGMDRSEIQYEMWNEPNLDLFWPRSRSRYHEMWERGVSHIRSQDPNARIVGPGHNHFSWELMSEFLDMAVETGTVPDILNWHVLQPNDDAVDTAASARDLLAQRGLTDVELEINEYVPRGRESPGYTAWDLARVEKADVDYAALANWSYCCSTPAMCGTLTQDGSAPTGRWWLLNRYGQTGGDVVRTEASDAVDSAANRNALGTQSRIVVGNNGQSGQVDLSIQNVDRIDEDRVRIKVERMPDQAPLAAPLVDDDYVASVAGGEHTVGLDWSTATDAFVLTVTPATAAIQDGTYRIEAVHSGHVLGVADGASGAGASVTQQADAGTDRQRWAVEHLDENVYRLENVATGLVLAVDGSGTGNGADVVQQSDGGGAAQRWRIEETRSGVYRLEATHSAKPADVEAASTDAGANVHQWVDRGGENQRWRFVPVDGGTPTPTATATPTDTPDDGCTPWDYPGAPSWSDGTAPRDIDGDGVYEDFNGNCEFDADDVVTYFQEIDREGIQNNPSYYDANGNGNADFDDIVTLFQRL